jgi:uncharacterized metal-binding protein
MAVLSYITVKIKFMGTILQILYFSRILFIKARFQIIPAVAAVVSLLPTERYFYKQLFNIFHCSSTTSLTGSLTLSVCPHCANHINSHGTKGVYHLWTGIPIT